MSKKFEMKYLNKNGQYETLVPDGVIANDETKFLSTATADMYDLSHDVTVDEMFQKIKMPQGYYGFNVTTKFSDGTIAPNVYITGICNLQGQDGITTNSNGIYKMATATSSTPTIKVTGFLEILDTTQTLRYTVGKPFCDVTITLQKRTNYMLVTSSTTVKSINTCNIDITTVGGGGSGGYNNTQGTNDADGGGGGGYATVLLNYRHNSSSLSCVIGAGGTKGYDGGATYLLIGGQQVCKANGGGGGGQRNQNNYNMYTGGAGNGPGGDGDRSTHLGSKGADATVYIFNDSSLGLAGGGGGAGFSWAIEEFDQKNPPKGGLPYGALGMHSYSNPVPQPTGIGGGGAGGGSLYHDRACSNGYHGGIYLRPHWN